MKYSIKAKVAIVCGIGLIVFVTSLLSLPFSGHDIVVQKATSQSLKKVDDSEQKMLDVIANEKAELEHKIGKNLP